MIVVGIGGYARAGKDTTAQIFVQDFGFVRYGFADALREVSEVLDPALNITTSPINDPRYAPLSEILARTGNWDAAKTEYPSVRQWLQRLGTEAGREILGDTIWVDTLFKRAEEHTPYSVAVGEHKHEYARGIVIPDVRFHNELKAVTKYKNPFGGNALTIWIQRHGVAPVNTHASDNTLGPEDFDIVVRNDGSIADLRNTVAWVVEERQLLS